MEVWLGESPHDASAPLVRLLQAILLDLIDGPLQVQLCDANCIASVLLAKEAKQVQGLRPGWRFLASLQKEVQSMWLGKMGVCGCFLRRTKSDFCASGRLQLNKT